MNALLQNNPAFWGALLGASGVALGAFGVHGLRAVLSPEFLAIFETAVRYQLLHALLLVALGSRVRGWPPVALLVGTLVFSGSLYALVGTGIRLFGAVTPIGGVLLIAGWLGVGWKEIF